MAIWNAIKSQLRSVIQWDDCQPGELFELWSQNGDEIKNASKLIVNPGQGVIFVYEGKIQAVHLQEGTYDIKTANEPFVTTFSKYMQAFESEHKVGIYFFWRTQFVNQKWGTTSLIKYLDPIYKFPVGLRAFGNFSFQITKPEQFFTGVIGARPLYTIDDARILFSERFVQQLSDLFANAAYGFVEIDKHRIELANQLITKISPDLDTLGFSLTDFRIEGTDFDEGTKSRIGRIADLAAEAEGAKAAGVSYAELQQLQALRDAAKNESSGAVGAGVGIGAGMGLGQMFAGSFGMNQGQSSQSSPTERLKNLKELLDQGLLNAEEYESKRAEIVKKL
jgi:membrane protease subunit (stomatin/prohibitin family)